MPPQPSGGPVFEAGRPASGDVHSVHTYITTPPPGIEKGFGCTWCTGCTSGEGTPHRNRRVIARELHAGDYHFMSHSWRPAAGQTRRQRAGRM